MGAIAFFIIMGIMALIGIPVAVLGLVGTVLSACWKRKVLLCVSIAGLVLGMLLVAFPVAWIGSIVHDNVSVPEDFVETGIVMEQIDEKEYQVFSFTANGVKYAALELNVNNARCSEVATAAFEYRPEGIMNRSRWKNYYRLDNPHEFDLIWDGYRQLFCPESQKMAVLEQYLGDGYKWTYRIGDEFYPFSDEASAALRAYPPLEGIPEEAGFIDPDMTEIDFYKCSGDGIVILHQMWIGITKDAVYELLVRQTDENGNAVYSVLLFPDELAAPILKSIDLP